MHSYFVLICITIKFVFLIASQNLRKLQYELKLIKYTLKNELRAKHIDVTNWNTFLKKTLVTI